MKPFHSLLFVSSKQPTWLEKACSYRAKYGSYPLTGCIGKKGATYAAFSRGVTNAGGVSHSWIAADC